MTPSLQSSSAQQAQWLSSHAMVPQLPQLLLIQGLRDDLVSVIVI